jgi:fluoride exporter
VNWLLVAIGGAVGCMARYGTALLFHQPGQTARFPWATLTANLLGCMLIGYFNGVLSDCRPEMRMLLMVGFLGGYTTFSTFGLETASYLREGLYLRAATYLVVSNVIGVVLVFAGDAAARIPR